jgi:RNA polymerase sigma-70 factor (ECF subfamily)
MERDEILLRLRERIVAFAASRIAGDAAEDLAQETLMLLHDKYAHVTRLEELFPLSMQIMRFKMVALRRKSYRRGETGQVSVDDIQIPDLGPDPATFVERKEMMERMTAAIGKLGARCREIFRLRLLGRSFAEIQSEMGASSINTVYTWDARCRKQLLDEMGGHWEKQK